MKLTRETLKGLIKQVIKENQATLVEEIAYMDQQAVFDALAGKDFKGERILTLGIMSGQNPDAIEMSAEENTLRAKALEDRVKSMDPSLDAFIIGGVFGGNNEKSLLIINPHKAAGDTASGGSPLELAEKGAMWVMNGLNKEFGQWGYVLGTKEPDDPVNAMRFEMVQMDKYSKDFADDYQYWPEEDEYEDLHHGQDYMQDPLPSPEAPGFGKKAPGSKIAKSITSVPKGQKDFSYVPDPDDPDDPEKAIAKFGIPLYEVKVGRRVLRIKRKK